MAFENIAFSKLVGTPGMKPSLSSLLLGRLRAAQAREKSY
jgi:hypothetical protein